MEKYEYVQNGKCNLQSYGYKLLGYITTKFNTYKIVNRAGIIVIIIFLKLCHLASIPRQQNS